MDCVVNGHPTGMKLACEVRSQLMSQWRTVEAFNHKLDAQHDRLQYANELRDRAQSHIWSYARMRMKVPIPAKDSNIGPCWHGAVVDDFKLGERLGEGCSGKVFALTNLDGGEVRQVLKVIEKKPRTNMVSFKILCNEIRIMEKLSTQGLQHKNLVRLYQVYHSEDQILLRMESGGTKDL